MVTAFVLSDCVEPKLLVGTSAEALNAADIAGHGASKTATPWHEGHAA